MLDFQSLHFAFKPTLDRFEPSKQKRCTKRQSTFQEKTLRKAIKLKTSVFGKR